MFAHTLKRRTYALGTLLVLLPILLGLIAHRLRTDSSTALTRRFALRRPFSSSTQAPQHADLPSHYQTSVAFQPKSRDDNSLMKRKLKLKPVDSPSGEDNYFTAHRATNVVACGVADGVGGWAEMGFDSSAISRELCSAMKNEFEHGADEAKALDPMYLLDQATKKITEEGIVKVGGTTACLGVFKDHTLRVANLGDSWCGVFRENKLVAETKIQTHGFNTPYQLAIIPKEILNQHRGSNFIMDKPADADTYEFKVEKGDVVMFATDGVIDNVAVGDIELFLKDNEDVPLDKMNTDFVQQVAKLSRDESFPSVFSQELSKLTGQFYSGGKEDDITVVLVRVTA